MRRALALTLTLVVLFAGAVWAGFYLAGRMAPERLRLEAERRLSRLLNAAVQIEEARLSLRWGLVLEADGVVVRARRGGSRLRIERASANLDPVALLTYRFGFDRLLLEEATLRLQGAVAVPKGESDLPGAIRALEEAARSWLEATLPVRTVELRSGTVVFADPAPGVRIEAVSGVARRASFRRRTELRIRGQIRGAEEHANWIQLRAEADRTLRARLRLEQMDLAILQPFASQLGIASKLEGSTDGTLSWHYQPGRPQSLVIRLKGSGLRASLPQGGEGLPFDLAMAGSALYARIEFGADALQLREAVVSDGRVTLRADGSLELPVSKGAALRLALQLDELPLPQVRELLAYLPPELRARLAPLCERLEEGRLLDLHAEARTTVAGLPELIESRMLSRPGEVTLRVEVADAGLRIGPDDRRLEALSGTAIWSGDALELRQVRGRLGPRTFPRLDVSVNGLSQIRSPSEVNCIPPPSEVSLPGFGDLQDWIRSQRKPGGKPSWQRLTVDADWILHPALVCSVEHALGELLPAPDGLDFAVQHGVWAGVPIRGTGSYRRTPEKSLRIEMSVGPPFEPMQLEPAADPWAQGRWEYEFHRLGQWRMRGASGSFRISGSTLRLEKSALLLAPLGELEGNLEIALGSDTELRYRLELQVRKLDLADLQASSGREEEFLSGRLLGAGVIDGRLHQGLPFLSDAEGPLTLHARDGKIHQKLPVFVAIAVASDRFDPFRYREELPYTAIDFSGRLEEGQLRSDYLSLDAPSLGMVVSGQVGAVPPHDVEAVVGLFFFPALDSLINRVPVLNRVILGQDENLVGAYFAMTGNWKQPRAQLIPIKSFAEGPAHFMLEGPEFIWNGLRRLEALLNPSSGPPPAAEAGEPGP